MDGVSVSDVVWDSSVYALKIPRDTYSIEISTPEIADKPPRPSKSLVDMKLYKDLLDAKDRIEKCSNWKKWSKLTNLYEKVPSNESKDFYKYYEILTFIGYGTGECTEECTGVKTVFSNFPDATKALGKKVSIELVPELVENSIDVVLLNNDNVPELMSILAKHLAMILPAMKEDGIMIIRIFETVSRPICQLIFYMTMFFDVELIKPRISRRTNSEKFIVATKFRDPSTNAIDQLKHALEHYNKDNFIRSLGVNIPTAVENMLFKYNNGLVSNQYSCIEKTLSISNGSNNEQFMEQIETFQNTNAMIFCNAFGIKTGFNDLECKHQKRKKINSSLKMLYMCEKCFIFLRP
jgi:hypothetical protein